jgi:hypothetical protein
MEPYRTLKGCTILEHGLQPRKFVFTGQELEIQVERPTGSGDALQWILDRVAGVYTPPPGELAPVIREADFWGVDRRSLLCQADSMHVA